MNLSALDRLEAQETISRLYLALDGHSAEGFAGSFTPDGVFKARYGEFKGREAIASFIRSHIEKGNEEGARHMLTNFVVDPQPDGAQVRCYLVKLRFDKARVWMAGTSKITAQVVKQEGRWLIKHYFLEMSLEKPQGPPA
jgi:uncharacterized protein (TIGR02246 family)